MSSFLLPSNVHLQLAEGFDQCFAVGKRNLEIKVYGPLKWGVGGEGFRDGDGEEGILVSFFSN